MPETGPGAVTERTTMKVSQFKEWLDRFREVSTEIDVWPDPNGLYNVRISRKWPLEPGSETGC